MSLAETKTNGEGAPAATCWRCRALVGIEAAACKGCGVLQPPRPVDYFTRLGLKRAFGIERAELERHYFDLQRRFHPDRFAGRPAEERALALRHATALNEAYDRLKTPLRRAEYLLTLLDPAYKRDDSVTEKDPELLMEALEKREALAEAADTVAIDRLASAARVETEACLVRIARAFDSASLAEADRDIARLKYLSKFLEDARDRRRTLSEGAAA